MCHKSDVCLVLLVGIPGSGKTFFRSSLENYFKVNSTAFMRSVQVFSICYDDYCKVRNPQTISDSTKWKDERRKVLKDVENMVVHLKGENTHNLEHVSHDLSSENDCLNKSNTSLIVIDDNMYYRSMRFEYFKIAKIYSLSFCQLFFNVSLDEALKCNNQRSLESQVPEDIIVSMFHKIEPPDPCNSWEKNSLIVTGHVNFAEKNVLNDVLTLLKNSLENPIVVTEQTLNINVAQTITNSNTFHQIDNILKQLVGTLIKKELEGEVVCNAQTLSREYSSKRLSLLKEIKDGTVILPIDLTEPFNHNALNLIKQKLLELLLQR